MNEQELIDKLRRIEALFGGATTEGERAAAQAARERIQQRLKSMEAAEPPIEYRFTLADSWSRLLFAALARRYGLSPFRYHGQRHTTVMLRVSKRFVDETLWPEYVALDDELRKHLEQVTERVIRQAIHGDSSDVTEVPAPHALPSGETR